MAESQHARKDPYYPTQEKELEARRILLAAARTGDRKAKTELLESYGAKIYSAAERKKTKVMPLPAAKQKPFQRSNAMASVSTFPSGKSRKISKKS